MEAKKATAFKIFLIFFVLFFTNYFFTLAQSNFLERLKVFMPKNTEFIESKEEGSVSRPTLTTYVFKTYESKDSIYKFYSEFFKREGFVELEEYTIAAQHPLNRSPYYLFTKPNRQLVVLNIQLPQTNSEEYQDSEDDSSITYFITVHHIFMP